MDIQEFDMPDADVAWCPGCGNFNILTIMKTALASLDIEPVRVCFVSGIGQAAKLPHYIKCNVYNGLHGRALPPATGIKAANPNLIVIAESGDGCMYGEGGNHLLGAIRRNPDITCIVHNNMVYGLTKGQASPTSQEGFTTPVQTEGVKGEAFNPIALAISQNNSFVARCFSGDMKQSVEVIKQAILHKGFSLIDMLHPCVSFNKINTFKWFKEHIYYLDETHNPLDREMAFRIAIEPDRFALGVIYRNPDRTVFEESTGVYDEDKSPLHERRVDMVRVKALLMSMK